MAWKKNMKTRKESKKKKKKKSVATTITSKNKSLLTSPSYHLYFHIVNVPFFSPISTKKYSYENYIPSSFITLLLSYPFYTTKKNHVILCPILLLSITIDSLTIKTHTKKKTILHLLF